MHVEHPNPTDSFERPSGSRRDLSTKVAAVVVLLIGILVTPLALAPPAGAAASTLSVCNNGSDNSFSNIFYTVGDTLTIPFEADCEFTSLVRGEWFSSNMDGDVAPGQPYPATTFTAVKSMPTYGSYATLILTETSTGNEYTYNLGVLPVTPGAPSITSAVGGDTQVAVNVAPPADTSTTQQYTVTAGPGGATCTATRPATSCTITGLTNGVAYTFTAVASNDAGTSIASAPSSAVTPAQVTAPGEPRNVGVVATSATGSTTSGRLDVTFEAPLSDGGSAITGYEISTDGGTTFTTATVTGSGPYSTSVLGLSVGAQYSVQVRALNAVGIGAASAATTARVPDASAGTTTTTTPGSTTTTTTAPASAGTTRPAGATAGSSATPRPLSFTG